MFADMYPSRNGRPSMPPQILAAAVTLQALHGLSDIETVQELRCDLRWKAACGLGLYDTAFDSSLLAYFRRRLSRSADPQRIFTAVRAVVAQTGVLKGKVRRALDSTVLDDAVATQDTVTQIIAAIRRVAREVPGADEAVAAVCTAHDYTDPGKPKIAWNDEAARTELVDALVTDVIRVLAALPQREHGPKAADALGLLALVAGQDVEPADDPTGRDGRWRIAKGTATDRMVSTVDPHARHVHKTRSHKQDGYKAHLAIEPETGIYTAVAIRPGAGVEHHEANTALDLLEHEPPGLHLLGDTAYCTTALRAYAREHEHAQFLKPPPLQPAVAGGFTLADFRIETATGTVACPAGHTVTAGRRHADGQRVAAFTTRCVTCPLKERCTTAKNGRQVRIRPDHDDLETARHQAEDRLAGRVPALAPTRRTRRSLAREPQQPAPALPRRPREQHLDPQPRRSPQPPHPTQPRTEPHRRALEPTGHSVNGTGGPATPTRHIRTRRFSSNF